MICLSRFLAFSFAIGLLGCASSQARGEPPLETVPYVDLQRYLGKWYEIASFPQSFSEGCVASSATYSIRNDGDIAVVNECRLYQFDGDKKTATGVAKVVDQKTNAKLRVTFFWPFFGSYWIIDLGENYDYAVVGHPSRNYLWILSRTSKMDETLLQEILDRIVKKGYKLDKLQMTPQP